MKKLHLFSMALIAALTSAVFTSCSNEDELLPEPAISDEGTVYEVKLNFDGDAPSFTESEEPLSRDDESTPKRVYGINVWCMKTDATKTSYNNYAYGLFDNKEDMVISLLGGYKYRFECYMVEDDEEELYVSSDKHTGYFPFNQHQIKNKFNIGSDSYNNPYDDFCYSAFAFNNTRITTINSYSTTKSRYSCQDKPVIGIYYGILPEYTPSQNSVATIPIYKLGYCGLRIAVTGVPDGSLFVQSHYVNNMIGEGGAYWGSGNGSETFTFTEAGCIERKFTDGFYRALDSNGNYNSSWLSDMQNFSTTTCVDFSWTRANGYTQRFSKEITLKRNVMTVLTVNLTGGAGDVSLGIEEHSEDMSTENDSVDFDGGDPNDTPVNPEE